MYTRGSASARASGAQNRPPGSRADRHAVKPPITAPEEVAWSLDEPPGVVPERPSTPKCDGYERAAGKDRRRSMGRAVWCRHPTYEARFLWCRPTNPTMTRSFCSSQAKAIRIVWCGS